MANKKTVDTTKKSNIKCEHCKHWCGEEMKKYDKTIGIYFQTKSCELTKEPNWYWNRCKSFEWKEKYL